VKLIFVNGQKASLDTVLKNGDQVGLSPPVGGMLNPFILIALTNEGIRSCNAKPFTLVHGLRSPLSFDVGPEQKLTR
jgi:hypothetical protein